MDDGGQKMDDDGFQDCIEVADEEIIPDHINDFSIKRITWTLTAP